jgi:radical SAM protein with 4Fe4S-binding SPASM domain
MGMIKKRDNKKPSNLQHTHSQEPKIDRIRYESFGGIISCLEPPFLAWVDKNFMRGIGYRNSPLWNREISTCNYLSAPTEVHWAVTNRCNRACTGCYMDSQPIVENELSTKELKRSFKKLRDLGVFHVALGGGEAFERDDFMEIAAYCREIGLVPNLTTNGQIVGAREIEICKLMGQVNISCDAIGKNYGTNGRKGEFDIVTSNIRKLRAADVKVGINCVVSRNNFTLLPEVIAFAVKENLNEVEFLKYKPSGRGKHNYESNALTQEMIRTFYPMIMNNRRPESVELKVDCSFIPALLYHKPPKDELEKCAVTGCDGGNVLLSVKSNGIFAACSFMENNEKASVFEIKKLWHSSTHLKRFRDLTEKAQEPCTSCRYLSLCRCGCRAIALFYTGDFYAPDTECPFVYDYHTEKTVNEYKIDLSPN